MIESLVRSFATLLPFVRIARIHATRGKIEIAVRRLSIEITGDVTSRDGVDLDRFAGLGKESIYFTITMSVINKTVTVYVCLYIRIKCGTARVRKFTLDRLRLLDVAVDIVRRNAARDTK